jgi:hypothetical protein
MRPAGRHAPILIENFFYNRLFYNGHNRASLRWAKGPLLLNWRRKIWI